MKMIKNLIALMLFTFTLTTVNAQSATTKELLIKKWAIDVEAMKPVIVKLLEASPEYAGLDEAGKEETLNTVIDQQQLSSMKIEYKKEGVFAKSGPTGNTTGSWTLSTDEKELTTKEGDKPEKKYTIVSISKTILHLKLIGKENADLFLKTENQ